jgi:hypothetical protein
MSYSSIELPILSVKVHMSDRKLKKGTMVAIGVTGHRILTELDKINASVDETLRHIEQVFPGQPLTVLSSLAEGADRLVVHRALARSQARLVVPLPLPKAGTSDYVTQDWRNALEMGKCVNPIVRLNGRRDDGTLLGKVYLLRLDGRGSGNDGAAIAQAFLEQPLLQDLLLGS